MESQQVPTNDQVPENSSLPPVYAADLQPEAGVGSGIAAGLPPVASADSVEFTVPAEGASSLDETPPLQSFLPPVASEAPEAPVMSQTFDASGVSTGSILSPVSSSISASDVPSKRPSNKKLLIIILSIVAAVLIIGGVVAGVLVWQENQRSEAYASAQAFMSEGSYEEALATLLELGEYQDSVALAAECERNIAYNNAVALMDSGAWEDARQAFLALGDFKDSLVYVSQCEQWIDFEQAQALYEAGKPGEARSIFATLALDGFADAEEWRNKCDYDLAAQMLADGKRADAYSAFLGLGSYSDAAARAEECKVSYPSTGEIYHNGDYNSSAVTLTFDGASTTEPYFIKIYSGSTLVSAIFLNAHGNTTIYLPSGGYSIKEAIGTTWFGEDEMFGPDAVYKLMVFEDGESTWLEPNYIYTITLRAGTAGNVSGRNESYGDF